VPEGPPIWLKAVLRLERLVGTRVEAAVHSDTYFDLVTHVHRSQERLGTAVEEVSARLIHLANLPAGTDIRRVRAQLARMERTLVDVSKQLEDQAAGFDEQPAPSTQATPAAASAPRDAE
jgi:hypothetical protein